MNVFKIVKVTSVAMLLSSSSWLLASCGGGGSSTPPPQQTVSFSSPFVSITTNVTTPISAQISSPSSQAVELTFGDQSDYIDIVGPNTCTIPAGQTACSLQIKGLKATSNPVPALSVSAYGYKSSAPLLVTVTSGTISFSSESVAISTNIPTSISAQISTPSSQDVQLTFGDQSQYINIVGSSTCTIPAGQTACSIQIQGVTTTPEPLPALTVAASSYISPAPLLVSVTGGTGLQLVNFNSTIPLDTDHNDSNLVIAQLYNINYMESTTVAFISSNPDIIKFNNDFCVIPAGQSICYNSIKGYQIGSADISIAMVSDGTLFKSSTQAVNVTNSDMLSFPIPNVNVPLTSTGVFVPVKIGKIATTPTVVTVSTSSADVIKITQSSCTIDVGQSSCNAEVLGVNNGTANLYATAPGYQSALGSVVVTNVGLTITPANPVVWKDKPQNITANIDTIAELPVMVTFATSDTNVISVGSSCTIPVGNNNCSVTLSSNLLTGTDNVAVVMAFALGVSTSVTVTSHGSI